MLSASGILQGNRTGAGCSNKRTSTVTGPHDRRPQIDLSARSACGNCLVHPAIVASQLPVPSIVGFFRVQGRAPLLAATKSTLEGR